MPSERDRVNAQSLDDYRITSAVELQGLFKQLIEQRVLVNLSGPGGHSYTTVMWQADASRGVISLGADAGDPALQQLLGHGEIVAVAYLDRIKVQFELEGAVQVRGADTAINARFPSWVYRFQRRASFRVRPLVAHAPVAQVRHPAYPDMALSLAIADISLGGVALSVPPQVPMFEAGVVLNGCLLELDADTQMQVVLAVHHVTVLNPDTQQARLGCEIVDIDGADERALQNYINQTQKRRNALVQG